MFTRKNPLSSKPPNVRSGNSSGNGNFVGSRSNGVRSNGVNNTLLNRYAEFNPKKKAANAAAAKGIVINPTLLHAFLRVYQKEINKLEEDIKKLENDLATPKSANRNSQEDLMWGFLALKTEDQLNDYKYLKAEGEKKLDAIKKLIQKSDIAPGDPEYEDLTDTVNIIKPDIERYLAANPGARAAGGSRRRSTTRRRRRR
jgi:hypothetical protein